VTCPGCARENRSDARFCDSCGRTLAAPDAATRAPSSYTPRHLAEKILRSRSALEGERKQVTVLFADVKGSLELAEQVDPESWHVILDRFFAILAEGVHRFEGTVNQYTGDGIMALFGAPIAHEDHALRACHAALWLREELRGYAQELRRESGLNFSVRMGLNTGPVVVGKIGDDMRMDYTAQGHTVGLAARMEQLAEPGAVYLSAETAEQVRGYFELEDLGEFKVKGTSAPVRASALLRRGTFTTRLDVSRERGFSRFVGRESELGELQQALADARGGKASVIGVCAQAGTGKSRLCHEFAESCRAQDVTVLQAHALSHGQHLPLLPIVELLRAFFGVSERDPDQSVREKVAGRLVLLQDDLRDSLPLFFDLLGVPDPDHPLLESDPGLRRHQVFETLRRLLRAVAREGPAVLLIEDLHWIDDTSDALLAGIAEAVVGTELLLLVNYRPGYAAEWMQVAHFRELALVPLGPEAATQLVADLLGDDPELGELAARICEQAEGNPFFIEEVVRALAGDGTLEGQRGAYRLVRSPDALSVPDSVQGVLAARIDRLAEREKHVLQAASVIGKRFDPSLLGRVAELPEAELAQSLALLRDAEFIDEGQVEYAFRHPLTQEVSYDSQLRERRVELHARAAAALQQDEARVEESAALISHHLESAGDLAQAAIWSGRAAERLAGRNPDAGRESWRKVLALLDEVPEDDDTARLTVAACSNVLLLSFVAGISTAEATNLYYRGRAAAEARGWNTDVAALLSVYGLVTGSSTGDAGAYERCAREAFEIAERSGDRGAIFIAAVTLAPALQMCRKLPEARRASQRSIAEAEAFGPEAQDSSLVIQAQTMDANLQALLGDPLGARLRLDDLLARARATGVVSLDLQVRIYRADVSFTLGDERTLGEDALRAAETAERVGAPLLRSQASVIAGTWHALRGAHQEAAEAWERVLELSGESHTGVWDQPFYLAQIAHARSNLGEHERARALAAGALERSRQMGTAREWTLLTSSHVLLNADDRGARSQVESALDDCAALIEETGWAAGRGFVAQERARLAVWQDDPAGVGLALEQAREVWTSLGAAPRAEAVGRLLSGTFGSTQAESTNT